MQNVLVTGATGFVGHAMCRRMLTEDWNVHGTTRSMSQKALLPPDVESVEIRNIGPTTEWESALEGIDTVVHLAARVHLRADSATDPIAEYRLTNVSGTIHLARTAATKNVRRFIYLSSIKVNGEGKQTPYTADDRPGPSDPYGLSKFEAEQKLLDLAEKTDLEVVILRPPLVYGPGVKANFLQLIKMIDRGIPLPLANVQNHRSFIYLENLVDALMECIVNPAAAGQTFLLSDGVEISTPELIRKVSAALEKPSRLFSCPLVFLRYLGKITGKSRMVSRLLDSLTVNMSKIQLELNWHPPFTMDEGLQQTARWYRQAADKSG